jgi:hypothetical protein
MIRRMARVTTLANLEHSFKQRMIETDKLLMALSLEAK